jgi:dynein heavy chain
MCVKLRMSKGEVNEDEWNFFLRGGLVMDRTGQPMKPPFDWITPQAWDNITELEKLIPDAFTGIANAITLNPKEW